MVAKLFRLHVFSGVSFNIWRKKFGGMNVLDTKRLKMLEAASHPAQGVLAELALVG